MRPNSNDIKGMVVYFLVALLLGGGVAVILLALHEDNDRCHYYNGIWNKKDIINGLCAVITGSILRYMILRNM